MTSRAKFRRRRAATVRVAAAGAGLALCVVAGAMFLVDVPARGDVAAKLDAAPGPAAANGSAAPTSGATPGPAAANGDAALAAGGADAPVVPIGERYDVTGTWTFHGSIRRDYSGVLHLAPGDSGDVPRLWLVDDKPDEAESLVVEVRLTAGPAGTANPAGAASPAGPANSPDRGTVLSTRPVRVDNPLGRPLGDDVEDLDALPAGGGHPMLVALVGERGPGQRPVSWLALGIVHPADGGGVALVETREASPPGESVGNDGLEGVALLALGGDTVAVMTFKERTPPIYVRSYLYRWARHSERAPEPRPLVPIGEPLIDHVPGVATQAAATFGPDGDLYVLDRYARRIAVVPRAAVVAALRDPADNALVPREWLDFAPLEPALEGRPGASDSGAPLSIFGTAEGLAFGPDGTLYLLADNNESGPAVLMTLMPRR